MKLHYVSFAGIGRALLGKGKLLQIGLDLKKIKVFMGLHEVLYGAHLAGIVVALYCQSELIGKVEFLNIAKL